MEWVVLETQTDTFLLLQGVGTDRETFASMTLVQCSLDLVVAVAFDLHRATSNYLYYEVSTVSGG